MFSKGHLDPICLVRRYLQSRSAEYITKSVICNGSMSPKIRDHMRLFLLSVLNEDPGLLSLCTLNELISVFVQEMNISLDEKACVKLKNAICSFFCDLINEEGTISVLDLENQNCVPVKCAPAVSDNGKHVVMLSREEVIKLAAATVSDKTNPVVSLSKDGESISQRIKQLRQTPLLASRSIVRACTNNEVNSSSDTSILQTASLKNIQIIHTIPPQSESNRRTESVRSSTAAKITTNNNNNNNNNNSMNSTKTFSSPILSSFLSQSSLNDRQRHTSAPSSSSLSLNSGSRQTTIDNHFKPQNKTQANNNFDKDSNNSIIKSSNISNSKMSLIVKRQLSEAVVPLRPSTNGLYGDIYE
uniref:Uncharacterized protein n=1 Tax=Trichobilharzia regenti TaxID=157069 RepID=A0AA85JZX5_TRIRE|nr:unnamed protein product [Trichobilharzia regenti]